ncbi:MULTISPECIES: RtcB family protein [unclassified Streptomyces]|uniref:RtcB family protein n=1 Tax=unclassified Streptomyces TaxID=2593676 RepID=UPI0022557173|nr:MULTISPECIES: RtcB family protein [unclassified Streptomyces]MCX5146190.1 RtcB family protein [Streptomyces sp. NBC_00320]WSN49413.1 RtcB family protein [Streptomyces sp. NBC_01296]WSW61186.1 RtcB family protein [Streptomyces sp. NBC_00998]
MSYVEVPGAKVPIRMWTDPASVEAGAMQQLHNVATLPWIKGLAVMPDVHYGKGATVGSVIAMKDAVCPAAVGVDIGCGMSAVKTSLTANDLPGDLSKLRSKIEQAIPVGAGMHRDPVDPDRLYGFPDAGFGDLWERFDYVADAVKFRRDRALRQMGSLGQGNHFCELCIDTSGSVWLMLHSGSRNIGNELAAFHIDVARGLSHNQGLVDRDLAVFLAATPEMEAYRNDLFWAQEYAKYNRAVMMSLFKEVIRREFRKAKVSFDREISCHHNYVAEERYDGMDLLVTRKGAIRAGSGDYGIIPGSMGTGSYIVKGLGNEKSFNSASHGAGRKMSRTAAKKRFSARDLADQTKGVECRKDSGVVDEIPGAYKSIEQVIDQQTDLVQVVAKLKQVICIKG